MADYPSEFHPTEADAGQRLDQFLAASIPDVSRARVQQLIAQGKIQVDGKPAKASHRLRGDEEITLLGPAAAPPLKAVPEDIPLDVIHEDAAIAIIDKPAGMMVHAGAAASGDEDEDDPRTHGTLVNALLHRFRKLSSEGGELRPGIVHRLDKETSGLMVVAKTDVAHRKLAEQFSGREVEKKYIALVHGWPKQSNGIIDAPIGRDPVRRNRMSIRGREGRHAVSHYKVVQEYDTAYGKFALVEVRIETGRTHQIRVHMASIGHPVVGDTLYGAPHDIEPLAASRARAVRANTKANRDRQASDAARQLTEAKMGGAKAGKSKAAIRAVRGALSKLHLDRNFLHAAELAFKHPASGRVVRYESELPLTLRDFLRALTHPTE